MLQRFSSFTVISHLRQQLALELRTFGPLPLEQSVALHETLLVPYLRLVRRAIPLRPNSHSSCPGACDFLRCWLGADTWHRP